MTNNDLDINVLQHCIGPIEMNVVDDLLRTQKSAEKFI